MLLGKLLSRSPWVIVVLLATGCTVYAPMQPQAPVIKERGRGEASLQTQATIRAEGSVAYSPANHVLVMASGGWRPQLAFSQNGEPDGFQMAQLEAGVGAYWMLGPRWLSSATLGAGIAKSRRQVTEFGLSSAFSNDYEARYHKFFGQVNVAYLRKKWIVGMGYRLTQVSFTELTATSHAGLTYALPLDNQLRHEPFGFIRYQLGRPDAPSRWQLQVSTTLSFCLPGRTGPLRDYDEVLFRSQFNRGGVMLLGFGVLYGLGKSQ